MPKQSTYPTLFEDVLQLHLCKLKEWGYLEPNKLTKATYSWSRNGKQIGSISIYVNSNSEQPFIELDYNYKDEPRKYKVLLTSTPSNLGKGLIWYFICPSTGKRCRKLYSIGGYFLHREAFKGCMYEKQTQSKYSRKVDKTLGAFFDAENLAAQLYKKHFKQTYAGKPTKRYLRIMEKIDKAESIPYHEIERLMLS
jgi:hypothetical protein